MQITSQQYFTNLTFLTDINSFFKSLFVFFFFFFFCPPPPSRLVLALSRPPRTNIMSTCRHNCTADSCLFIASLHKVLITFNSLKLPLAMAPSILPKWSVLCVVWQTTPSLAFWDSLYRSDSSVMTRSEE